MEDTMRRYHEVTKLFSDALYAIERVEDKKRNQELFEKLVKLSTAIFKAVAKQYNLRYDDECAAPPLAYNAPILGEAACLLNEFEAWVRSIHT